MAATQRTVPSSQTHRYRLQSTHRGSSALDGSLTWGDSSSAAAREQFKVSWASAEAKIALKRLRPPGSPGPGRRGRDQSPDGQPQPFLAVFQGRLDCLHSVRNAPDRAAGVPSSNMARRCRNTGLSVRRPPLRPRDGLPPPAATASAVLGRNSRVACVGSSRPLIRVPSKREPAAAQHPG